MRYYFVSEIARTHNISKEMLKYKIKSGHIAAIKQQTCHTNPERIAYLIPESELEKLKDLKLTEPSINPKAQPRYYEMLFAEQEMQEQIMQKRREEYRQNIQTPQIKALRTIYNGVYFRSRLEAKWAIFFDHCGIEWEYEPEGYQLENGMCYLPDFLLHGLEGYAISGDLYIEVKGVLTDDDTKKLEAFMQFKEQDDYRYPTRPILVLGNIFTHKKQIDKYGCWERESYFDKVEDACKYPFFTHETLNESGDWPAILGINEKGNGEVFGYGGDYTPMYRSNMSDTESAYEKAKNAVFSREGIYQYSL